MVLTLSPLVYQNIILFPLSKIISRYFILDKNLKETPISETFLFATNHRKPPKFESRASSMFVRRTAKHENCTNLVMDEIRGRLALSEAARTYVLCTLLRNTVDDKGRIRRDVLAQSIQRHGYPAEYRR